MPTMNAYFDNAGHLAATPTVTEASRAALAYRRILDKPSSVAFKQPDGTVLDAQIVRLESDNTSTPAMSDAGTAATRKLIVFGIQNHATLDDTDMQEGYRFVLDGQEYRIQDVIATLGELQGVAEAVG